MEVLPGAIHMYNFNLVSQAIFFLSLLCMLQIVSIQYLLTQDLSIVPKSQEQIRFWLKNIVLKYMENVPLSLELVPR